MANNIYSEVTLDVTGKNHLKIWAKQYDSDDRFVTATIVNGDEVLRVDPNSVVTINARREEDDAQNAFVGTVNENGTVTLPITYWMTYYPGTVTCDVSLYLDGRLSSLSFKLKVEEAATDPSEVIPVEDRDIVTALINDCQDATSEAESATSAALESAQAATTAANNANTKAGEAESASVAANAGAFAANTAAQRAEAAAEQLDVDLTEIRSDIADNTRRLDNLDASDVTYNESTDPNVEMVSDELLKLEDENTALDNRVTSAEGNISSLGGRLTTAEGNIVQAQNNIGNLSQNKEDKNNKVQEILDEQTSDNYPSVPAVIDYIDGELSNVQNKNERVSVVNAQSTNNTYPTSKAVYDAIQEGGGTVDAYTKAETDALLDEKEDVISDLAAIRSGAADGETALDKIEELAGTINTAPVPNKDSVTWYVGLLDANGVFTPTSNFQRTSDYIELKPSITYKLEIAYTDGTSTLPRVCSVYDSYYKFVRNIPSGQVYYDSLVLNASADEKYIRVNHSHANNLDYFRVYEPSVGYEGTTALKTELPVPQDEKYDIQLSERKDGAYIHPRRPVLAITIDGTYPNTANMLEVAEKKGVSISVGIPYNEQFTNYSYDTIKGWQDKGHEILMHTSQVLDDNYDLTTGNAIITNGARRMRDWGFRANGLLASSGYLADKFMPVLKDFFEYGSTVLNSAGSGQSYHTYASSDPYRLKRYGLQQSTVAEVKAAIDATMSNNGFCWLYGHARNDGTEGYFKTENFAEILQYALDKNIDIKTPYEAIKDYYSLRTEDLVDYCKTTKVNYTAVFNAQTSSIDVTCSHNLSQIITAMQNGDLLRFSLDGTGVGMLGNYTTCNYIFDSANDTLYVNILVNNVNYVLTMDSSTITITDYTFTV